MKKGDVGIEREVDNLGRIVLPIEIRKKMGIERNSKVLITTNDDTVFIKPSNKVCSMCKKQCELIPELGLCKSCIEKVKNYNGI